MRWCGWRSAALQLVRAGGGLVHAVPILQQLEELLHGDPRVGGAPQGEDLPQQHAKRPAAQQTVKGQTETQWS